MWNASEYLNTRHRGQFALEHALFVTVVAAALIILGVYVRRSINANLKTLEEDINVATAPRPTLDCSEYGGTLGRDGVTFFCWIPGNACPENWSPYANWSTTEATTCTYRGSYSGCEARSCTTSSHTRQNRGRETCHVTYCVCAGSDCCACTATRTCRANILEIGCIS